MVNELLPKRIDNTYRGAKLAPWLFAVLLFMKTGISMNCIFNGYSVATSADGKSGGKLCCSATALKAL